MGCGFLCLSLYPVQNIYFKRISYRASQICETKVDDVTWMNLRKKVSAEFPLILSPI